GLPQRYVRLPKDCSSPLTMESNILTSGLSISAEGLLIGLYRPNPSLILASSGFELLFSIHYYANYLLNIRMSIKIKVKLEELKSIWSHVLTLGVSVPPLRWNSNSKNEIQKVWT